MIYHLSEYKRSRIVGLPDIHLPEDHEKALDFSCELIESQKAKTVIQFGDVFDLHNYSKYENHHLAPSRKEECDMIRDSLKRWGKRIKRMICVVGNHDIRWLYALERVLGRAVSSHDFTREMRHWFGLPAGWEFHDELNLNLKTGPFRIMHGDESGASKVPGKTAMMMGRSVMRGHNHSLFFIHATSTPDQLLFDVFGGCLVNLKSPYAFKYKRKPVKRDVLGAVSIVDGVPQLHPMFFKPNKIVSGKDQIY